LTNRQRWDKLPSISTLPEKFLELRERLNLDAEGRLYLELPGNTMVPQMILLRDFFTRLQKTIEDEVGIDKARKIYHDAAAASAYVFAKEQARSWSLTGIDVFRAYLRQASLRGWGQARVSDYDEENCECRFTIRHSYGEVLDRRNYPACLVWIGAAEGIMRAVLESMGKDHFSLQSEEIRCVAQGNEFCEFLVRRADSRKFTRQHSRRV
jgi:hypothetical protein